MSFMEGQELIPNISIYHAIITAFGKAGDADASFLYFEEMKRKGFKPNHSTYLRLLDAISIHQLVGLDNQFGVNGRWVRPSRKLSQLEKEMILIGKEKAVEISSRGMTIEGGEVRGKGDRVKPHPAPQLRKQHMDHSQRK